MAIFSERYGHVQPSNFLVREQVPIEVQNSICNFFTSLKDILTYSNDFTFDDLSEIVYVSFLNLRKSEFDPYEDVITDYILGHFVWYKKLDLLEFCLQQIKDIEEIKYDVKDIVLQLNKKFQELNYAYRVINWNVIEITTEVEIESIEKVLSKEDNVSFHLNNALKCIGSGPSCDPVNSIKESISAVECCCKKFVGDAAKSKDLNEALKILKNKGLIPDSFKGYLNSLYHYTCSDDTGIRHSLMDESKNYSPHKEEAIFMIATCSAFINYLRDKISIIS